MRSNSARTAVALGAAQFDARGRQWIEVAPSR
jgi:hypothetical protein